MVTIVLWGLQFVYLARPYLLSSGRRQVTETTVIEGSSFDVRLSD